MIPVSVKRELVGRFIGHFISYTLPLLDSANFMCCCLRNYTLRVSSELLGRV